jgi:hypothetical protein
MNTHFLAAVLAALGLGSLSALGQLPIVPSLSVEQTQFPVFEKGSQTRPLANFRLHLDYKADTASKLFVTEDYSIPLPSGSHLLELTCQQTESKPTQISIWIDGKALKKNSVFTNGDVQSFISKDKSLSTDQDFTVAVSFQSTGDGTLFSKCAPKGPWSKGSKALFIKDGRLTYDVGWVGDLSGPIVNDGKVRQVVLRSSKEMVELSVDGKLIEKKKLASPDVSTHPFKIGLGASDFIGPLSKGTVTNLRYWNRSIEGPELISLLKGDVDAVNTPDLNWSANEQGEQIETFDGLGLAGAPVQLTLKADKSVTRNKAWVQPLESAYHAKLIKGWNKKTLAEGKVIYDTLCIT